MARSLRGCVHETDFIARLAGDEFAVVQTSVRGHAQQGEIVRLLAQCGAR